MNRSPVGTACLGYIGYGSVKKEGTASWCATLPSPWYISLGEVDDETMGSIECCRVTSSKMSGVWVFRGTRVPVAALFENFRDGATINQFLEWFPGVTRGQVEAVLDYEAMMLTDTSRV